MLPKSTIKIIILKSIVNKCLEQIYRKIMLIVNRKTTLKDVK